MSQIALAAPGRIRTTPRPPALRLTRRGRLVLGVAPALLALGLLGPGLGAALQPAHATDHLVGPGLEEVTVLPGESLWSLASSYSPSRDTRDVVREIQQLNDLTGPLRAGETITVPSEL